MTAPAAQQPAPPPPPASAQPPPTVDRHRTPERKLLFLVRYPFILVWFGPAAWLLHQRRLGIEITAACVAAMLALTVAAGVLAARKKSISLAPAAFIIVMAAAAATWFGLRLVGLGWLRFPALVVAAWLAGWALHRARLARRRRRAEHRWAQVLEPEVSVGRSQAEQLAAGLAGIVDSSRVTAPHLGVAPHAAWSLRGTRWKGAEIREAKLRLPWLSDIRNPELMLKIKFALKHRAGVPHVRLSTDPLRDEITITVLDGPDEDAPTSDLKELATERARTVADMILKGASVTVQEFDEAAARHLADTGSIAGVGAGHLLIAFTVEFDPTMKVTRPENRMVIVSHISTQLYGEPDQLRAVWRLDRDTVVFRRRREFPEMIRHLPLDLTALYGDQVVLPFAEDEDGEVVVYPLSKTSRPHGLVIGPTGGGKTVLLVTLAIEAARLGIEVWGCDPKRIELMGLRGWPNVTKIATHTVDMIRLVDEFYEEMLDRYWKVEHGQARMSDFRRILFILDEYFVFVMRVAEYWAGKRAPSDPKVHPVLGKINQIAAMSRSAGMHIVIGVQRPDAAFFGDGARDNFGYRVSLGPLSPQAANMLWGDYHTGTDLPPVQGLSTATSPGGPVRAKVRFTPNPADKLTGDLSEEDLQQLLSLLPPDTTWDGPLIPTAPDPGFEDTAGAHDAVGGEDPATALLTLVRACLRCGTAYLTDGATGGPPATGGSRSVYGWTVSADGAPAPSGTWIGCAASTSEGRRIYLYPQRAYDAASAFAGELGVPFRWSRDQLSDALRTSGLVVTEDATDGQRGTVRRSLPGNDLPGQDRQRVWDLSEDAVLGELPAGSREPGAGLDPAAPGAAGPGGTARTAGALVAPSGAQTGGLGDPGGPWAWACELPGHEGEVIILPNWAEPGLADPVEATLVAATPDTGQADQMCLDYLLLAGGSPGGIVVDSMTKIWFAQDGQGP